MTIEEFLASMGQEKPAVVHVEPEPRTVTLTEMIRMIRGMVECRTLMDYMHKRASEDGHRETEESAARIIEALDLIETKFVKPAAEAIYKHIKDENEGDA